MGDHAWAPTTTGSYLTTLSASFFFMAAFFFLFVSLDRSLFSEYFSTVAVFSLSGEYDVCFFPLPAGGFSFLPCDHGLDFLHRLFM